MRVLFFTIGFTETETIKDKIRSHFPFIVRHVKSAALLFPSRVQRMLLSGYSQERRVPSGLGSLSAVLKERGHIVELADRLVDSDAWPSDIKRYDFVGIHATTPCYQDGLNVLARLRHEGYKGPIAMGGPHTTLYPETIPATVDYIVQGEAECIINDLVEGKYPKNSIIITPRIKDLNELPRIDYSLFFSEQRSYELNVPFFEGNRVINLTTSRSCPWQCSFCATKSIWGRLWKKQSPATIVEDIKYLRNKYAIDGIYFREDLFTADKARVYEFCRLLVAEGLSLPWALEIRSSDACDEELVAAVAGAGCRGFYIGAESGSQRILDKYVKECSVEDTVKALELSKKFNIKVALSVIVAHPEEAWVDKYATYKMIRQGRPEILQTSVFNGAHTGLNDLNFERFDCGTRQIVRANHSAGTWSGQEDRKFPVPVTSES